MTRPQTPRMYGWRFYRISRDRLLSPFAPRPVELPHDGVLHGDPYFFIERERVWSMTQTQRSVAASAAKANNLKPYDIAVTYGLAFGPFRQDPDWLFGGMGSLQCARYQALAILTDAPGNLAASYDIPIIDELNSGVLADLEHVIRMRQTARTPVPRTA